MKIDPLIKEYYYGDISKLIVIIRDSKSRRKIDGKQITGVKKDGFFLDRTFIPSHRILEVKYKS